MSAAAGGFTVMSYADAVQLLSSHGVTHVESQGGLNREEELHIVKLNNNIWNFRDFKRVLGVLKLLRDL